MSNAAHGLLWCPHPSCERHFTMQRGLTRHLRETHGAEDPALRSDVVDDIVPPPPTTIVTHPVTIACLGLLPPVDDYTVEALDRWLAGFGGILHTLYLAQQ